MAPQICRMGMCAQPMGMTCDGVNCPGNQLCDDGMCEENLAGCTADFDCLSGRICEDDTCLPACTEGSCGVGLTCDNGRCVIDQGNGGNP